MKPFLTALTITGLLMLSCCTHRQTLSESSSFKEIITLHSSDNSSIASPILIRFSKDVSNIDPNTHDLFSITPEVKGTSSWYDHNTLKFTPEKTLKPNQTYRIDIGIDKLFKGLPDSLTLFSFQLKTRRQHANIHNLRLSPLGKNYFKALGSIETADVIDTLLLKKILKAEINNEEPSIRWTGCVGNHYSFEIDSIERKIDPQQLVLTLETKSIEEKENKKKEVTIAPLGDFKFINAELLQEETQKINLLFSDIIDSKQSLEGLVIIEAKHELIVKDNVISIHLKEFISKPLSVTIDRSLLNKDGFKLQQAQELSFTFSPLQPAVKLKDNNTILPYNSTLPFTFYTVNLNAVDIRIIKIYQKNILQFLQENNLDGNYHLNYVGEEVFAKTVKLSTTQNLNLWSKQTIDLKSVIKKDLGAIYHIELGFKKSHSTFLCDDATVFNDDLSLIHI